MKNLSILFAVLVIVVFASFVFYRQQPDEDVVSNDAVQSESQPNQTSLTDIHEESANLNVGDALIEPEDCLDEALGILPEVPEDFLIIESDLAQWKKGFGYFTSWDRESYASYDEDTLRFLGETEGDLLALDVLFSRLSRQGRPKLDSAIKILKLSISKGSTNSALTLAIIKQLEMKERYREGAEFSIDDATEVMALYELASVYGDIHATSQGLKYYTQISSDHGVDLDLEEIRNLARQQISDLGIGDIERPEPSALVKSFIHRKHKEMKFPDNYAGWGLTYRSKDCSVSDEEEFDT